MLNRYSFTGQHFSKTNFLADCLSYGINPGEAFKFKSDLKLFLRVFDLYIVFVLSVCNIS